GGAADFNRFIVEEPNPRGLMRPIPLGRKITLEARGRGVALGVKAGVLSSVSSKEAAEFSVIDRGMGRVALRSKDGRYVVARAGDRKGVSLEKVEPGAGTDFQ